MLKTILITVLKLVIAGSLIYWLLTSGKLDFKLLGSLKNYPLSLTLAAILSVVNYWLTSVRWRTILSARSDVQIPLTGLLKITWIGQFFSSVLPGSVSGDLVKIMYVQNYDEKFSKKFLLASIFIDRLMGLSGLILLVGLSSLMFTDHILENAPDMRPLLNINYVLAAGVILALTVFTFLHHWKRAALVKLQSLFLPRLFDRIIILWDDLVSIRHQMLRAVALSLIVQLIGVVVFWSLINPYVGEKMDFVQALAFIPLGFMTLALPVAPSGLGVGHAIFQKLFEFSAIPNGASLFNLYFVVNLTINVLGVIPYLLNKRTKK